MESINIMTSLLLLNSFFIVLFILNQNESARDAMSQSASSLQNPFEKITWIALLLEFSLLLIRIKSNEF